MNAAAARRVRKRPHKHRPPAIVKFLAFRGWIAYVEQQRETARGVANMLEEMEQQQHQQWMQLQPGYCATCDSFGYSQGTY